MMEGSGAGSVILTNGSGWGPAGPKHIWILIPNTTYMCANYKQKRRVLNSNFLLFLLQVEQRNPGADDNNLNSIFYEHLTRWTMVDFKIAA
jgi:hypothetical protein